MCFTLLLIATCTALISISASASERDATAEETRLVKQELRKKGYSNIDDVDVVNGRFEVDARSPKGGDVDVILDMKSLKIISIDDS